MKPQNRLTSQSQAQEQHLHQELANQSKAFAGVEEMLRHDALHTPVPPRIAHRLVESIGQTTPANVSWWRRLFGS